MPTLKDKAPLPANPICVKVPDELRERARLVEEKTGATFSGVVRVALTRYVNEVLAREGA